MPHAHMAAGASAHLGHTPASSTVPERGRICLNTHHSSIWHPAPQLWEYPVRPHAPKASGAPLPCTTVGRLYTVGAGRRSGFLLSENNSAPCFSTVELQATPQHVAEFTGHLQKPLARASLLHSSATAQISTLEFQNIIPAPRSKAVGFVFTPQAPRPPGVLCTPGPHACELHSPRPGREHVL